jgi:hypothetical protein
VICSCLSVRALASGLAGCYFLAPLLAAGSLLPDGTAVALTLAGTSGNIKTLLVGTGSWHRLALACCADWLAQTTGTGSWHRSWQLAQLLAGTSSWHADVAGTDWLAVVCCSC